jgi:hypothetical protein
MLVMETSKTMTMTTMMMTTWQQRQHKSHLAVSALPQRKWPARETGAAWREAMRTSQRLRRLPASAWPASALQTAMTVPASIDVLAMAALLVVAYWVQPMQTLQCVARWKMVRQWNRRVSCVAVSRRVHPPRPRGIGRMKVTVDYKNSTLHCLPMQQRSPREAALMKRSNCQRMAVPVRASVQTAGPIRERGPTMRPRRRHDFARANNHRAVCAATALRPSFRHHLPCRLRRRTQMRRTTKSSRSGLQTTERRVPALAPADGRGPRGRAAGDNRAAKRPMTANSRAREG